MARLRPRTVLLTLIITASALTASPERATARPSTLYTTVPRLDLEQLKRAEALFNAAAAFEQAGRIESATRLFEQLSEQYPTSKLVPHSLITQMGLELRMHDYAQALDTC